MYVCMVCMLCMYVSGNVTALSGVLMSALLNQSTCMYAIEVNESAVVDFSKAKNKVYVAAAQPQGYPGK